MNSRAVMAKVVTAVSRDKTPLDEALKKQLPEQTSPRDKGLIQEVCFGVIRHYQLLLHLLARFMDKPLKQKDADIKALLLCGLYQLHYLNMADHAAVSETVAAAKQLQKTWAGSLVNAVLRRSQREFADINVTDSGDDSVTYLHPLWMIERIKQDWPTHWQQILTANNARPPQHLRVNLTAISRADYLQRLSTCGITARPVAGIATAIQTEKPVNAYELPGFGEGLCTIQDAGAQYAAVILAPERGERVLDGCAAPGGKTSHLYEHAPAELLALDITAQRCALLQDTVQRTGAAAHIICADVRSPEQWWDGRLFDRILLDVPCSASGVIRRHPDIKLLRTPEQLQALDEKQLQMLQAVWPTLKPDGRLLYASCSVFRCENDAVIERFLQSHSGAESVRIELDMGIASQYGRQLLPGVHDTDGFYYSLLRKVEQ
ncbi:MAG: 16S rRNA (cytosine(967)-C(5))-methyltransferase RsmB [Gammaproteobacteria bacterium]